MKGPCQRRHLVNLAALAASLTLGFPSGRGHAGAGEPLPPAVLVRVTPGGKPEVVPVLSHQWPSVATAQGLLIWADRGGEAWQILPPTRQPAAATGALAMVSRYSGPAWGGMAVGGPGASGPASAMLTVQLDQLIGQVVFRGDGLLTPARGGRHVNPKITIRRRPSDGPVLFPATTLELKHGGRVLARIPFQEGQGKIGWADIPGLPGDLQAGLRPGEYALAEADGGESTAFSVEDAATAAWVMEIPSRLERLLGTREHPLYLQVAADRLLAERDEQGHARPYAADALDLLESAPAGALTPYTARLRDDVLARLAGGKPAEQEAEAVHLSQGADATGVPQIDAARRLIGAGQWEAALAELDSQELEDSPRSKALAALYRAVILAESGQARAGAAEALFRQAIAGLEGNPADACRARNNYAGYLLVRAQDRLYNHAFQISSGVPYPLISALVDWQESLRQYEAALALAKGLGEGEQAAVEVNLARLYALLADVIRTFHAPISGGGDFPPEVQAAACAERLASAVLAAAPEHADHVVRAASHEIVAQLAYRNEDPKTCREHAQQAVDEYLKAGALAGVESAHRTLGLLHLRESERSDDSTRVAAMRRAALQHLLISHLLCEFLRDQVPADQAGLSRAGFFARRAYVNEQICLLLLAEGKPDEALRYAELAKARGLQDVLAVGVRKAAGRMPEPRSLPEILASWPGDTAALEYFLGTEQAWVFLIHCSGRVSAHRLCDGQGRPLASRDLVARTRSFLARLDHQAEQMRARLAAGMGYDATWQYELHEFYRQLLPKGVIDQLRKARTVLVVPHHILHYFPFVALVTQPDTTQRTAYEMVKPRFLLDEPFSLACEPSLAAWDLLREKPDRPIGQVSASGIVEFGSAQPLPGVEKDLANLKAAMGPMLRTVLSNEEASETRARGIFNQAGLLFLATHGKNFADRPLSSYLMFRADRQNDGYLTAAEIYSLEVAADLVVLSACYSGLADRSPLAGDDLFGLQRALLHAGARTVVAGLWDVYDGTGPELMRVFFDELVSGKPVPAALANSQRALLNKMRESPQVEPWLHPYFWAVYTAAGDDRTRMKPARRGS